MPLDSCDADTQGAIGYMIQQSLANEFRRRGMNRLAVTLVTQVEVAADSPAFTHPSKPIGSVMDETIARDRAARYGWAIAGEIGHGWRRVVPSPEPLDIIELDAIRHLVRDGYVVTAVGGGGIPVTRDAEGDLHGVEAVIDKDLAAALLARLLRADLLVISTDVRKVCLNFRKTGQRELDRVTLDEAKRYLSEGQFGPGSMAPKVQGIIRYLDAGGQRAIVTCPGELERAVAGNAGTAFVSS